MKKAKKAAKLAVKQAEKTAKQAAKKTQQTITISASRKQPVQTLLDSMPQDHSTRLKIPIMLSTEHINPNQHCVCLGLYDDDVGTGC